MKALIIQTMLALLIPGLTDTPKALLTPPSNYDFSIASHLSSEYLTHEWTYGTPTNRFPLDLTKTGGNNWSIGLNGGFTWNNTIYSIENSLAVASIKLIITTPDIYALNEATAVWGSNYLAYTTGYMFYLEINNFSKYPIRGFFDTSSMASVFVPFSYVNDLTSFNQSQHYFRNTQLNGLYIPPFAKTYLVNGNTFTHLDAMYFDVISPTITYQDYEDYITDEAFNSGYNDGYTTAYDEFGNFDWLSSLFSTMGDLLAIEILPGITIGLILLIPIVFGVLRFIMGLFR